MARDLGHRTEPDLARRPRGGDFPQPSDNPSKHVMVMSDGEWMLGLLVEWRNQPGRGWEGYVAYGARGAGR